jgi:FAD/FMN-containing dehydrogenase/Fe-S oxidoreductase
MDVKKIQLLLETFKTRFEGDIHFDEQWLRMYATDASAYREIPLGVARPKHATDIRNLILFAKENHIPLIPRAAGTSLAGQVVGNGLVVDVSRYMTDILEMNENEHWVRVQPGVILDELNTFAAMKGLFFGPETSTSSRCMMAGMVGNNSCGAHSILYGSTRDHVLSLKTILSDGSEVEFKEITKEEFSQKMQLQSLEGEIYRNIHEILSNPVNQENIRTEYPHREIHRRNTGYAIDLFLESEPFAKQVQGARHKAQGIHSSTNMNPEPCALNPAFNFSNILAGSEGTLAFITEIKLNLVPLPPKQKGLICVHCHSVAESLKANLIALKYEPGSVELMDKPIMDCTKDNIMQRQNRFFIEGDPAAILIIEFARETKEEILDIAQRLEKEMREAGLGYHFPIVFPPDVKKVWDLRKAGLGVLSNYPGDRKPVPVTEDTAVRPEDLPDYIEDFAKMMEGFGRSCVYYAHVGSGELHLRPVLNLKDPDDIELFHSIALETAKLVKKYRGSLSGEHGDGRLRGEFIPMMIGEHNYKLLEEIKKAWDPDNIFNPGKITATPQMNSSLRYEPGQRTREIDTVFDFSNSHGIQRAAEQCNGSGDCRNTVITGRFMCPSYMAVKDESTTTRARANILREFLTNSTKSNPFDHKEIYEVMDLCLSCKACKSECPSNVDMAKLKAEFLQHYYDANGIPLRSRLIANITSINRLGAIAPSIYNFFQKNPLFSGIVKNALGFANQRRLPLLYSTTLRTWARRYDGNQPGGFGGKKVYLFVDEFTNFNDVEIGIKAIKLLNAMGYQVTLPDHGESGRTFLSKGLVRKAKKLAIENVTKLKDIINKETPLIGIEPSAILTFRDEYPELVGEGLKDAAIKLGENALMFDEFVVSLLAKTEPGPANSGPWTVNPEPGIDLRTLFTKQPNTIKLHGHCHQKSLASVAPTIAMLSIPENYKVEEIKSGCCGMAGSFGYEKEHYEVSMKVGELVLFPEVRKTNEEVIISAPGTSCRHQIFDGTGRQALHPVEVLYDALIEQSNR